MKKEFKLTDHKKVAARQVDSVKHELSKYIARERRKNPADGSDFWDFDCKMGSTKENASEIHVSELNKGIDKVVAGNSEVVYVEIIAKPGYRKKKS